MTTRNSELLHEDTGLPRPARAPYLYPYRQGFRVLLAPLTYIPIGKVEIRYPKRAIQLVTGFTCWVFSMDAVISQMHGEKQPEK